MQYLAKRFADGKTRVSKMVADSHLAVCHKAITLAHGAVVEKQASLGSSAFLDGSIESYAHKHFS